MEPSPNLSQTLSAQIVDDDDDKLEEEEGEVIESAPPLQIGEKRVLGALRIKKKLLKLCTGYETPEHGAEATVHYVGTLIDGKIFYSTRDKSEPVTLTLQVDEVRAPRGLGHCIMTMKRGELALFTLPADQGYGAEGCDNVHPNSVIQFEIELFSWISVVDVRRDGGIIKKILEKGSKNGNPCDLDEVLVRYQVELLDGTVVAKSPDEGIVFCVNDDGNLCPALPLAIVTMRHGEKVKLIVQPQYGFGEEGRSSSGNINAVPPNSMLNIDVVLVSYKPVIDVVGDSKVFKKILTAKATSVVDDGATVTFGYVAKLED